jgi:catechol 1,2-dioxygenase
MIIENQAFGHGCRRGKPSGARADTTLGANLLALVRHLHGFIREVRLTEREFQEATRLIAAMGQHTTDYATTRWC